MLIASCLAGPFMSYYNGLRFNHILLQVQNSTAVFASQTYAANCERETGKDVVYATLSVPHADVLVVR